MINICPNCKGIIGNEKICPKCGCDTTKSVNSIKNQSDKLDIIESINTSLNDSRAQEYNEIIESRTISARCKTKKSKYNIKYWVISISAFVGTLMICVQL